MQEKKKKASASSRDFLFPSSPKMQIEAACTIAILVALAAVSTAMYLKKTIVPTEFGMVDRVALFEEIHWTSGTLLFFECAPEINVVLGTKWSHVSMVVEGEKEPLSVDITPIKNSVFAEPLRTVVLRELSNGQHRLAIKQLCCERSPARKLREFSDECVRQGIQYRHDHWRPTFGRCMRVLDISPARREGFFFCSDFVATALQRAGVLPGSIDCAEMLPPDLARDDLPTMPGYAYEPLTFLRMRPPKKNA